MLTMRFFRIRERDEVGAIAVVFAVSALVLFVIAGLVVDLGLARDTRRDSQNAADASALAAAGVLFPSSSTCTAVDLAPPCFTDAVNAAKTYAASNYDVSDSAWAACSDPTPYWFPSGSTPCISFTDDTLASTKPTTPTKVRVLVPTRDVTTPFGTLAGVSKVPVRAVARAALKPGDAKSCGLCVIGSGTSGLGNGDVTVNGGSVQINGSLDTGPNGSVTVTPTGSTISVAGGANNGCCNPAAIGPPNATTIADPLAGLTLLTTSQIQAMPIKTDPCSAGAAGGPGRYGDFQIPNSGTCTLQPGLYVVAGHWDMKNNSVISGTGVTLYGACGATAANARACNPPGEPGAYIDLKNGNIGNPPGTPGLVAPTTGLFSGYAVIYDRYNTSGLNLQGNGSSNITGTVYAVQASLEFPGNSCFTVTNGPVIVGSLYGNGNTGCLNLTSVNGANIPVPPGDPALDQ